MSDFIETLSKNYKQVIYIGLFLVLTIPRVYPLGLPIPLSDTTMGVYNQIEALEPGDVVVIGSSISASIYAEVYPQYIAVMRHVLGQEGVKVILVDHIPEAPIFTERAIEEANAYSYKTYGEELVHLGYIAGDEAAISGLCRDLHDLLQVDYHGTSISEISMLDDINSAEDFTIVLDFTASADSQYWLNQAYATYGTKIALGLTAVKVTDAYAYYTAGQIFGIVESTKGAAQYEILIDQPGLAAQGMDAQSLAHLFFIGLILVGNILYFVKGGKNQ
jgi:hypothetical protein